MKLALALALLPGVSAAAAHARRRRPRHLEPVPACCSVSTAEDCVRTHPCRAAGETDVEAVHEAFMTFMTKFEKTYETVEEWAHRLTVFAQNAKIVLEHDAKAEGFALGLDNQFADWTAEEFASYQKLHSRPAAAGGATHEVSDKATPTAVDWRTEGVVADIKNQGSCGSCWTFSTVVSIEGAAARKTGKLVTLSEQNLVDCVKKDQIDGGDECCMGCSGGLMDNAFDYIIKNQDGGIDTEASYGYTGKDGTCAFDKANVGATISNWTDVAVGDEWQLYSGASSSPGPSSAASDPTHADHGVAIVGYGTDDGVDYWWIRNSWGTTWGESGYMRLERGVNACGVANFASYPIAA
ncbi:transferase [Aureococcus anophagefferens]|nr:transferase [Aureococcus anophagefferens]